MNSQSQNYFQTMVAKWLTETLGETVANNVEERNDRFLEEAIELYQSLGGTKKRALQLHDYVFDRPVGEPANEVGGTMVTLAALSNAAGLSFVECGVNEYNRINTPEMRKRTQEKHASKVHGSPLPGCIDINLDSSK